MHAPVRAGGSEDFPGSEARSFTPEVMVLGIGARGLASGNWRIAVNVSDDDTRMASGKLTDV